MMGLRIALLGSPIIEVDQEPLQVDTRKAVAMLAYLAETRAPVSRDRLGLLLWPDASSDRSRASLRRTLSALRKGLGGDWIESDRHQVSLREKPGLSVDLHRFTELVDQGGEDDIDALEEAAGLYRGDFMEGFSLTGSAAFDDWQVSLAASYRRMAATVLERLSTVYAGAGRYEPAIEAASRWLALDSLHEPAHRHLMRLHAWRRDRASALRQYRSCARILGEELGVSPLEETTELQRAIVEDRVRPPERRPVREDRALKPPAIHPVFVDRSDPLDRLEEAYRATREGLSVVLVSGEPGIGKTRLIEEFVRGIDPPVIRARSYRGERGIAYELVAEAIEAGLEEEDAVARLEQLPEWWLVEGARLVPGLRRLRPALPSPSPVEGPGEQRRFLEGVGRLVLGLCHGPGPGALVLDDLQWADRESSELIAFCLRRLRDEPALVILAARRGLDGDGPLATLVREDSRTGLLDVVQLPRLDELDVARLVESVVPDAIDRTAELNRLSEGVPFFLVEYLTALKRDPDRLDVLPTAVRQLLESRTAGLSGLARQVLSAASVVGRSFDFGTIETAGGRSEEETLKALEELLAEGLIRPVGKGETFDFEHDRLRDLVYESTGPVRRRILHDRVADALVDSVSRGMTALAAQAAEHLEQAGRSAEAADQHLVAADHAAGLYANRRALEHYEAALALEHSDANRIRESIGALQALSGDYGTAVANLEAAAASAEGDRLAGLEHQLAVIHARVGDWELADTRFQAADRALSDPARRSRVLADWTSMTHRRGDVDRARELAERALQDALESSDALALAEAHNVLGIIERPEAPEQARGRHETALSLVEDADLSIRAAVLNNLARTCLATGCPEEGLTYAEEALEITRRIGDRHKQAALHSNLADLLHALGDERAAAEHLAESAAIFTEVGMDRGSLEPEIWMLTEW